MKILALFLLCTTCEATLIDLTLFNSQPVVNSNGTTPLQGTISGGDFVQVIRVGNNGVIDAPDIFGNPGGDDKLLTITNNPTYVGAGLPSNPNQGLLEQPGIIVDSSWAGSNIYVRFWNDTTPAASTYYGNSMLLTMPAGDTFGFAALDFAPLFSSPHTTDMPFSAAAAVPEPSNLFLLGLLLVSGYWWKRRGARAALLLCLVPLHTTLWAQDLRRFDVTASAPIFDATGGVLPGNNPNAATFGYNVTPGCLVQILQVGTNGTWNLPRPDGTPGGGDAVLFTTVIGAGMTPNDPLPGRFAASFYPPPADGTKLYARVFNAPTVAAATAWGQSATFTVQNVTVFDVSTAGLKTTSMPKGVDPTTIVDIKGQTYYTDLIANINPLDPNDVFAINDLAAANAQLSVPGRVGRSYTLERTTDDLAGAPTWTPVTGAGPLTFDQNLALSDPSPPDATKAFYRIRVTLP